MSDQRSSPEGGAPGPVPDAFSAGDVPSSASLLTRIIELAADAIITVDEGFHILQFNLGATGIFGYASHEVIGKPLGFLLPARVRGLHEAKMRQFAAAPDISLQMGAREDLCGLRRDGTEFPAEASISRIIPEDAPVFTVWLRNVTEQRRHEAAQVFLAGIGAALGSSLDYLQTLARAARAATPIIGETCIIDSYSTAGGGEITIADTDAELEDIARVMRRQYPPLYDSPALAADRAAGRSHLIAELNDASLGELTVSDAHSRLVRRLGWQSVLFVPIVARGTFLGILTCCSRTRSLTHTDLTLATELAHRAALAIDNALLYQRAKQAANTRDEVLGIVSHDLRSSLTTISLCAGALADPELPSVEGVRAMAEAIRHSTEHAQAMIADLVDVTSLEAGSLALKRTRVRPEHVLARAHEALVPQMERGTLTFRHVCDPHLLTLDADEARILQVLFNLLSNAVAHSRPGGEIVLRAVADNASNSVVFSVEDTGRGIEEAELPYVFDRFWQSHRSQRGGAGLGLAIAKGLVESHGGRLSVSSTLHVGSTFSFTVPVVD